jgi:hypothetical protein
MTLTPENRDLVERTCGEVPYGSQNIGLRQDDLNRLIEAARIEGRRHAVDQQHVEQGESFYIVRPPPKGDEGVPLAAAPLLGIAVENIASGQNVSYDMATGAVRLRVPK